MNKIPTWMGSDIGHGKRGGVLNVGGHDIKVGQKVPVDLLSDKAVKSLRDKGSIVDEDPENIESSSEDNKDPVNPAVKEAKSILSKAKKDVTASNKALKSAKKAVDQQQVVFDKTPDEPEATKVEVEEALQALKSDLEIAEATANANKVAVEQAKQTLADIED